MINLLIIQCCQSGSVGQVGQVGQDGQVGMVVQVVQVVQVFKIVINGIEQVAYYRHEATGISRTIIFWHPIN